MTTCLSTSDRLFASGLHLSSSTPIGAYCRWTPLPHNFLGEWLCTLRTTESSSSTPHTLPQYSMLTSNLSDHHPFSLSPLPSHTNFQSTKTQCIHYFRPFPILNHALFSWASSAALFLRSWITSVLPVNLATSNGVMPSMFLAPINAPFPRSSSTTPV